MKIENAEKIVESAGNLGLDVTLYENYSGRGMYGKVTNGVVGSLGDVVKCIAAVSSEDFKEEKDFLDFVEDMGVRWDNMGKSDVIIY